MSTKKARYKEDTRKGVFANLSTDLHDRMHRRAAAADHKAAKYVAVALEFYCDLEDAFGGPLTEQFRAHILRSTAKQAEIVKKALQ